MVAIFVFIFARIPFHEVADAVAARDNLRFVPFAFLYFTVVFVLECVGLAWLFRRFHGGATFREMMPIRGATYLLGLINYNVGLGGIIYYVHKKRRETPWIEIASSLLLLAGWDTILLVGLASYGLFFAGVGGADASGLRILCLCLLGGLVPYALVCATRLKGPAWLERLRRWRLLTAVVRADLRAHAELWALRLPLHLFIVFGHWVALDLYDIRVPFDAALVYIPVIILIGVLPISPHGWGTTQAASLVFFSAYGPEAGVLAYSLMMNLIYLLFQVAVGLAFLRKAWRDIRPPD